MSSQISKWFPNILVQLHGRRVRDEPNNNCMTEAANRGLEQMKLACGNRS